MGCPAWLRSMAARRSMTVRFALETLLHHRSMGKLFRIPALTVFFESD
jgi:hypothetical protein